MKNDIVFHAYRLFSNWRCHFEINEDEVDELSPKEKEELFLIINDRMEKKVIDNRNIRVKKALDKI
jgi:hypothetical protein